MSNRIDFHLRRSLLLCLLLASLVWGAVPLLRAEVPAGTRSRKKQISFDYAAAGCIVTLKPRFCRRLTSLLAC